MSRPTANRPLSRVLSFRSTSTKVGGHVERAAMPEPRVTLQLLAFATLAGCSKSELVRWQARGEGDAPVVAPLDIPCGPLAAKAYATDALTNAALRTVDAHRNRSRTAPRSFVVLSFPDPHPEHATRQPYASMHHSSTHRPASLDDASPVVSAVKDLVGSANCSSSVTPWSYRHETVTMHQWAERVYARMRKAYAGMVSLIDDNVGRLVGGLRQIDALEDTLLIFTSDHVHATRFEPASGQSPALCGCTDCVPPLAAHTPDPRFRGIGRSHGRPRPAGQVYLV